jgi:hypothetical protein
MVAIEGENMRQVTLVVIDEVKSGDGGIGGSPLSGRGCATNLPSAASTACSGKRGARSKGFTPSITSSRSHYART